MSCNAEAVRSGCDKFLKAYDCKLRREILFRVFPHCLPSANPQQAESSSVIGPGGKHNCVHGKAGGSKEERESDEGYHALFSVSSHHIINVVLIRTQCDQPDKEKQTVQETVNIIMQQLWLACWGMVQLVSDLQTETCIKDKTAQFWVDQVLEWSLGQVTNRVTNSTTRDSWLGNHAYSAEQKQEIQDLLKSRIQEETYNWLLTQPKEKWDELPEQSRAFCSQSNQTNLPQPNHT